MKIKDEAIASYKSMFEKELAGSLTYLSENSMINNHTRIKKLSIDLVNDYSFCKIIILFHILFSQ